MPTPGPGDRASAPPTPGAARDVGPYEILGEVGRGGMGRVYKARHRRLGRLAALKFLPEHIEADGPAKERFLAEARAAASLDHPNVCTVHDVGETADGRLFIAMAFCEGETLRDRIARGPLPVDEAVAVARQVATGLASGHAQGVVHRDVKPANVMVAASGAVTVVDFGIAKIEGLDLTRERAAIGTTAYMSPEQARGTDVDHRTDIWSLGVLLYEMLAGERPFSAPYEQAVIYGILHEDPEPLAARRPDVPAALADVVTHALSKDPDDRYPSLNALLADLDARPTAAPSPPPAALKAAPSAPLAAPTPSRAPTATTSLLPEGERRQATVVASTLGGYDALVEHLAPAEVDAMMDRLRALADDLARRHGGVVNVCREDEVELLFGVPVTHEDDAVRAARAARDLHAGVRDLSDEVERRTGHPLRLHTGLDTGLVVTQPDTRGDRVFRVTGKPAQAAGALAMHAELDAVLATADTRRLVASAFETEAGEPVRLKGRRGPATPYRIGEPRAGRDALEAPSRTAHAGRAAELEALDLSLAQALGGDGGFVAVVGEAGLGKSRFLLEFRRRLDPNAVRLVEGRCQSYGAGIPYLPLVDALRDVLGLHHETERTDEAVAERVRAVSTDLEVFVPVFLHLLAIPSETCPLPAHLEDESLRMAVEESLAALFTLSAAARPVVMLIEDWHWADDASADALAKLVEVAAAYPVLVIVTYRPGYGVEWRPPRHPTPIALRPLDAAASRTLLASVFDGAAVPERAAALLHERTGGNPFFLEEIARALREDGTLRVEDGRVTATLPIDDADLPNTVQAVLRTRIHRMSPEAQTVLRVASVVGREFSRGLLDHVVGDAAALRPALAALRDADLIHQTRVIPEAAYRFKHALTQEVAYDSLLGHQRKELHRRVGGALEALRGDRPDEQADLLAQHFSEAEAWERAVHHGRAAARRAFGLGQYAGALRLFDQVRTWLLRLPDGPDRRDALVDVLLKQEQLCERMGLRERQQTLIDEVAEVVGPGGTVGQRATVLQRQGDLYTLLRRYAEAEPALDEALRLRRSVGDEEGERNVIRSLGMLCWHADRLEEAVAHMERSLAIDRRRDDQEALIGDLNNLGHVLRSMGRFDEAIVHLRESLDLAEAHGPKKLFALHALARIHHVRGDLEEAKALIHRAIDILSRDRLDFQRDSYFYLSMANILWEEGEAEESLHYLREAVAGSDRTGDAEALAMAHQAISDRLIQLDRYAEALPHLAAAAAQFAQLMNPRAEALARSTTAVCHEKTGDDWAALAAWTRAHALFRRADDEPGELKALEGLADATRRLGDDPLAVQERLAEALDLARRLGDREAEGRLGNTAGIVAWEQGDFEAALPPFQAALAVYQDLDDAVHQALLSNSVGVTLRKLGRTDEAVVSLEVGAETARRAGQALLEGHALASLGEIATDRGDHRAALDHFERSLERRRAAHDRLGEGWMLVHLARTTAALGDPGRARELASQADAVARERGDDDLADACRRLAVG